MDSLSAILALLVTLSMATERVTETIKGLPLLSALLARPRPPGSWQENFRQAVIHIIAIGVGTGFAYCVEGSITSLLKMPLPAAHRWGVLLLFGGLASGGSGIWNSTLDLVRTVKQQKEVVLERAQASDPGAPAGQQR